MMLMNELEPSEVECWAWKDPGSNTGSICVGLVSQWVVTRQPGGQQRGSNPGQPHCLLSVKSGANFFFMPQFAPGKMRIIVGLLQVD